jgi:enamine deaminase RidA (YjgF/YER057c/UK114 family)
MPATHHNIAGFPPPPPGSSHATAAPAGRIVHVSGQPGTDAEGNIVPGGLAAQTERAVRNVALALEAAGARPEDVVKTTFYVVDWEPGKVEALVGGAMTARQEHAFPDAAVTLIGVQSLFTPDMLVEVEVVAVVQ